MKKGTGFCIRIDQGEQTVAAVGSPQADKWPVAELSNARDDSPAPRSLTQAMLKNPAAVTVLLPNDLAKAAVISLPQLKGKELARAVNGWIAREETGQPVDFSISWRPLPKNKGKAEETQQKVFALYAEHKEIQEQLDNELAVSIKPRRMLPGFMVLDGFYRRTGASEGAQGTWNLVFLGKHENFLVVGNNHCPLLTRGLPFDLSDGVENDQYVDQLATEIDRSGFYVRQGDSSAGIESIVVAGNPDLAQRLVQRLQERTEVPTAFWDIAEHFQWDDRPVPSESFIPLMAAALSLEKSQNNLLPEIKGALLGPKARRRVLVGAGSLGAALLPVLLVGSVVTAKVQEGYLRKARQQLDIARMEAEEAADIYKRHRILMSRQNYIESFQLARPDLEAVLLEIGSLAPAEVRFRDLRISEDELGKTRLIITGVSEAPTSAQAQRAFLAFQKSLDRSASLETYMEPMRLEIDSESSAGAQRPQTIFQMKYLLATNSNQEG